MSDHTKEPGTAAYGMVSGTSALCGITEKTSVILDAISAGIQAVLNFNQPTGTGEEGGADFIDDVNMCETQEDLRCTRHACVKCTNAVPPSDTVHLIKDENRVLIGNIGQLNKWDIGLENQFAGCRVAMDAAKTCIEDDEYIEGGMWQDVDELNDEGEGMETVNMETSYMICTKYGGIIYFDNDGQTILNYLEEIYDKTETFRWMYVSDQGKARIANIELSEGALRGWGLGEYDENDNLLGVYPYYVFREVRNNVYESDGGITFGYGHWIDQSKYEFNEYNRELIDTYAPGAPFEPSDIPAGGISYKVPGSSYLPMELVYEIYMRDLDEFIIALNTFLADNNIELTQYQFDALVSFTHQYRKEWWGMEDKLLPNFIKDGNGTYDPDETMEVFLAHDDKKRRKKEAELFIYGYDPIIP